MNTLITKLRRLNIELSLVDDKLKVHAPEGVLTKEIIEEIKAHKEYLKAAVSSSTYKQAYSSIPKAEPLEYYPLSSAQKRMYILHELDKSSLVYNLPVVVQLEGFLERSRLEDTFAQLIARHEALRTSFRLVDNQLVQQVADRVDFRIEDYSIEDYPIEDHQTQDHRQAAPLLQTLIGRFIRPFDLSQAPLLRVGLLSRSPHQHLLLVDLHHIISDGVSKGILIDDFMALYRQQPLAPLRLHYKDYAHWQQSPAQQEDIARQKHFWLEQFVQPVAPLELPTDFARPLVRTDQGGQLDFELDVPQTAALKQLAHQQGATLYMALLSVYALLLSKLTSQSDITIGTPTAGRRHADLENIMGMFVNLLPLRQRVDAHLSFTQLLARVKAHTLACFDNQDYQYEDLVAQLKLQRDTGRNPLFDVVFWFGNFELGSMEIPGLKLKPLEELQPPAQFDLKLMAVERGDKINCGFSYWEGIFARPTIERFAACFQQIASVVTQKPDILLSEIEIIPPGEKQQVLHGFNATQKPFGAEKLMHQLFEEQVARTPHHTAVIAKGHAFSYQWLNAVSNRIAHFLRAQGVGREASVVVVMDRDAALIAVLLGILKAGAKYVPVEPYVPDNRKSKLFKTVGAACILTSRPYGDRLHQLQHEAGNPCPVVTVGLDEPLRPEVYLVRAGGREAVPLAEYSDQNPVRINASEDLAYVIFTSGSSGEPKGVAVQHRPVINLIEWVNTRYAVAAPDKLLFVTSTSFDLSVYDIFGILASGAAIRVADRAELEEPHLLANIILEEGITFWDSAPAALQQVIPFLQNRKEQANRAGKLRLLFLSGDWVPLNMPPQLKELFRDLQFVALGGATEATVWSNFYEVGEVSPHWSSIPYGKPIQNAKYLILDPYLNLCPVGIKGDLYIGGQCLAREYLNDPQLSKQKFIPSPYYPGEMLYNTGDVARWFPDGNIEFLGRKDSQVKIRGYRIELGEIQSRLIKFAGISEVLVQVIEKSKYDKSICAYYVAENLIAEADLRHFLSQELPEYMIPKYFVRIDQVPVTPNGKVDRKALPLPQTAPEGPVKELETGTEKALATLWSRILEIDPGKIGAENNFFELGGHSLLAVHMANEIKQQFSCQLKLRQVFENPTIGRLAALIDGQQAGGQAPIRPAGLQEFYAVSSAQERLFFEQSLNKDSLAFNIHGAYELLGRVDVARLQAGLHRLVQRHEGLRTNFVLSEQGVVQKIRPEGGLDLVTLAVRDGESLEEAFHRFLRPFDLSADTLMRCALVGCAPSRKFLFVDIHHIVCDGLSLNILMNDFKKIYLDQPLPPLRLRYVDYALWQKQRMKEVDKQRAYWLEKLAGPLPTSDLPVSGDRHAAGTQYAASKILSLNGDQYQDLKHFTAGANVSEFMFLLSIYFMLIAKVAETTDVIIGTDLVGRDRPELEGIVGTFINLLPLRVQMDFDDPYLSLLAAVRECVLEAFDHQEFQYDQIVAALGEGEKTARRLFDVHFSFDNYLDAGAELSDLDLVAAPVRPFETTQYEFKLEVREKKGQLDIAFIYSKALYTDDTIELLMHYYGNLVRSVLENPALPVGSFALADAALMGGY